ncbi:MAG: hypothetical protein GY928_04900 [Colwellia sp.]|nr:hypothetical protein [Colwellia sp.]
MGQESLGKIKRNVAKMVGMNAPESDIDKYIASEGVTIDQVKNHKPGGWDETVKFFGDRFNRGLYQMANFPTDLANIASSAVGSDYQFKRPIEAIAPDIDKSIMDVRQPQSTGERVGGTVSEFLGGNTLPGLGLISKAPKIAKATANATGLVGQSVNRMAQGIANAPRSAALGEVGASIGSGLGVEVARGAAPDNRPAEILGGIIGGMAAPLVALLPANQGRKIIAKMASKFSAKEQEMVAREEIRKLLQEHITPEMEARILESGQIEDAIPGLKLSVAEATESPSLIATQRELESGQSGAGLDRAINRYGENEAAIGNKITDSTPPSRFDVDDIPSIAGDRISNLKSDVGRQSKELNVQAQELASDIAPQESRLSTGTKLREILIDQKVLAKEAATEDAQLMGLNDTTKKYDFADIRDGMKKSIEPMSELADSSMLPNSILDDIKAIDGPVSIEDLMALRSRITDDIRTNLARPDGVKRRQYLELLKGSLDDSVDRVLWAADDGQLAENLTVFRRDYLENYVKKFKHSSIGRSLKKNINGEYNIPSENVAREFFKAWNETGATQYNQTIKNHPGANAIMEAAAIDDLSSFALVDGVIDPRKITVWKDKHSSVLREFPDILSKVGDIEGTVKSISSRQSTLVSRMKRIENTALAKEIKAVEGTVRTPEAMVDRAILNPAKMKTLTKSMRSTEAKNGLARAVWKRALGNSNPVNFLESNSASIRLALGPEKANSALLIARAISKSKLVARPSGHALDSNPMAQVEDTLGSGINQISSRIFAVKSGRTSARYVGIDMLSRFVRNMTSMQSRELLERVIYNPQAARDLARAIGSNHLPNVAAKRLFTFIWTSGILETQTP